MDFARCSRKLIHSGLFLFFVILSGCYYDSYQGLHPQQATDPCSSTLTDSYSSSIQLIISSNCLSCHNDSYASGGVSLSDFNQVKQSGQSGKLLSSVKRTSGSPMPPSTTLPDCQVQRIQNWINQSYPQ